METLGIILLVTGGICILIGFFVQGQEGNQDDYAKRYARPLKYAAHTSSNRWLRSSSPTPPPRRDIKKQTTSPDEGGWKEPMKGKPGDLANSEIGQMITYRHPQRGVLQMEVLGTIKYVELWQKQKSPTEPWVPTGNVFSAHWLGNDTLFYEWKGLLFALDQFEAVNDAEIKRTFLEPARRFGQSDETADVSFAYPPGSWKITDIGKFRVREAQGEGLRLRNSALGRFIHAEGGTGLENRVLVVEDYQEGGGGYDTIWRGWHITWDDMLEIK